MHRQYLNCRLTLAVSNGHTLQCLAGAQSVNLLDLGFEHIHHQTGLSQLLAGDGLLGVGRRERLPEVGGNLVGQVGSDLMDLRRDTTPAQRSHERSRTRVSRPVNRLLDVR